MFKVTGSIIGIALLLGGLTLWWLYTLFGGAIDAQVSQVMASAQPQPGVITEEHITRLPAPAQRYFTHVGVIGKTIPTLVRITQSGRIRGTEKDGWMTLEAEQVYATNPPAFVWKAGLPNTGLPLVMGRDIYLDGEGSILMKMLAAFPVADEHGPEMGPAGLMRYLNEMMWFPAAYLGSNVSIAGIDDQSFAVTITDRGVSATGTLFIDPAGRIINFSAQRFNTASGRMETWETPIMAYTMFEGLELPARGSAVWKQADGDFTYIELDILDVAYDRPSP